MKTVGMLSFHTADNFGAVLQIFALQNALKTIGLEVEVINYCPCYLTESDQLVFPSSVTAFRRNLISLYLKAVAATQKLTGEPGNIEYFKRFRSQHLNLGQVRYESLAELRGNPPAHDVLVAGSDQIWNPTDHRGLDPVYFLDFGTENQRRVAYAPSFGSATIAPQHKHCLAAYLSRFDAISVREEGASNLIKEITNRCPPVLPDPTLLHANYSDLATCPNAEGDYLFTYVLRQGAGNLRKRIAARLGLQEITPYNPHRRWPEHARVVRCGPQEWLGLINDAKQVLTNSFHGTIFSILMKKQFVFVKLAGARAKLNERSLFLLRKLGLEDRAFTEHEEQAIVNKLQQPFENEAVFERLSSWRAEAIHYIENAVA